MTISITFFSFEHANIDISPESSHEEIILTINQAPLYGTISLPHDLRIETGIGVITLLKTQALRFAAATPLSTYKLFVEKLRPHCLLQLDLETPLTHLAEILPLVPAGVTIELTKNVSLSFAKLVFSLLPKDTGVSFRPDTPGTIICDSILSAKPDTAIFLPTTISFDWENEIIQLVDEKVSLFTARKEEREYEESSIAHFKSIYVKPFHAINKEAEIEKICQPTSFSACGYR